MIEKTAHINNDRDPALPKLWLGLIFAVLPFVLILWGPTGPDYKIVQKLDPSTGKWTDLTPPHPMALYAWIISLVGWIFWLYWIYRLNGAVARATEQKYSVSATKAVGLHIVPLYNLYWTFSWTAAITKALEHPNQKRVSPRSTGFLFCIALLIAALSIIPPGAVLANAMALGLILISGMLFSHRICKAIARA
jgi:hypothetical protein